VRRSDAMSVGDGLTRSATTASNDIGEPQSAIRHLRAVAAVKKYTGKSSLRERVTETRADSIRPLALPANSASDTGL